jgi:hypothetical protein
MINRIKLQRFVENFADIPYQSYYKKIHPISFWAWYFWEEEMEDWSQGVVIETW